MPRVRDSDEDVETKSSVRRTRASAAAGATDSPARRATRSNKQLSVITSSPESLDDSHDQPTGRKTRSRTATIDKGVVKNLRSRTNSGASDLSESVEIDTETIQKRVTRKTAAAPSTSGTPTRASLRTRAIRAGSETKGSPPTRSKRATRSNSVDPVGNESGTPIKRRTRASMVPLEPTVMEEREAKNKGYKSLENTVIEVDEDDSDNSVTSSKLKNSAKSSRTSKSTDKDTSNVNESIKDSEKSTLDASKKVEESIIDKSNTSNETIEESTIKSFTTHSINDTIEPSVSVETKVKDCESTDSESLLSSKLQNVESKSNRSPILFDELEVKNTKHETNILIMSNDNEIDIIDVEVLTETSLTDESTLKYDDSEVNEKEEVDPLKLDIKDSYVKLNRTEIVEKILSEKIDESKNSNIKEIETNNYHICQNNVITNAKTAIVLINDIVKNNQNFSVVKEKFSFDEPGELPNNSILDKNKGNLSTDFKNINDTILHDSIHNNEMQKSVLINHNQNNTESLTSKNLKINNTDISIVANIDNDETKKTKNSVITNKCTDKAENFASGNQTKTETFKNVHDETINSIVTNEKNDKENLVCADENSLGMEDTDISLVMEDCDDDEVTDPNVINKNNNIENSVSVNQKINETEDDIFVDIIKDGKNESTVTEKNDAENLHIGNNNINKTENSMVVEEVKDSITNKNNSENSVFAMQQINETQNSEIVEISDSEINDSANNKNNDAQNSISENKNSETGNFMIVDVDSDSEINDSVVSKNNAAEMSISEDINDSETKNSEIIDVSDNEINDPVVGKINDSKISVPINKRNKETVISMVIDVSDDEVNNPIINKTDDVNNSSSKNQNINKIVNSEIINVDDDKIKTVTAENENNEIKNLSETSNNKSSEIPVSLIQENITENIDSNIQTKNNQLGDSVTLSKNDVEKSFLCVNDDSINNTKNLVLSTESYDDKTTGSSSIGKDNELKDTYSLSQHNTEISEFKNQSSSKAISENVDLSNVSVNEVNNVNNVNLNSVNEHDTEISMCSVSDRCNKNETDRINAEFVSEKITSCIDKELPEPMEIILSEFDGDGETITIHIPNNSDCESKQNELNITEVDKNSVSSAVTDADGENASSPEKEEQKSKSKEKAAPTKKLTKKEQKESKQNKSVKEDSEIDSDAENLFQDIPAEEWSEKSQNGSVQSRSLNIDDVNETDDSVNKKNTSVEVSPIKENGGRETRSKKKAAEKETDRSLEQATSGSNNTSQEADESLSKKTRKSSEMKGDIDDFQKSNSANQSQSTNKSTIENQETESGGDENKSPNKNRKSLDKSVKLNQQSSEQKKNENVSENLSTSLNAVSTLKRQSISNKSNKSVLEEQSEEKEESKEKIESPIKSRKSLNKSKQNESSLEKSPASINNLPTTKRQSLDKSLKSLEEKSIKNENIPLKKDGKTEENSDETMDVDIEETNNHDKSKNRKSPNKSRLSELVTQNGNIKSTSPLNTSKTSKSVLADKSLNSLPRKSMSKETHEENSSDSESDTDKSKSEKVNNKSLIGNRKSDKFAKLNQSSTGKNESISEKLSGSLNDSKKSINKQQTLNESARRSLKEAQYEVTSSDVEMEVYEAEEKPSNKLSKSLNSSKNISLTQKQIVANVEAETSLKIKDKSIRKSLNKSVVAMTSIMVEDSSETEAENKGCKGINKSVKNKSFNVSTKSTKSAKNSPAKTSIIKDSDEDTEPTSKLSPDKAKKADLDQSVLDKSLQKSIERMKFVNPPKHDFSTLAEVGSQTDADTEDEEIPNHVHQVTDSDATLESENEEDEKSIASDIEREYNLGGKDISKYSDDDVPGDDCRASEQESSDSEDDGEDLDDFVVPDDEVQDDEDEEDEDEEDEDEEDEDDEDGSDIKDEEEGNKDDEMEKLKEKSLNVSKKDKSINSKSGNMSKSRYSQSSGSESDDEATEAESKKDIEDRNVNKSKSFKNKSINDSNLVKDKSVNLSNSVKDKSINSSKSAKNKSVNISHQNHAEASSSESDEEMDVDIETDVKEKSANLKDKSLNASKATKDKSVNLSKSIKETSTSLSKSIKEKSVTINTSKSVKNKSANNVQQHESEKSGSESEDEETQPSTALKSKFKRIEAPSSSSESEDGEDSYHITSVEPSEVNDSKFTLKNKKLALIECSTPKPGISKKTEFSKNTESIIDKHNLSSATNKSTSSKRRSGSLNDLTDTKLVTSRLSVGDVASKSVINSSKGLNRSIKVQDDLEIEVGTPEGLLKNRQPWKLIPLNQTAHPSAGDTPVTKFLKKSKLNESAPVLESMKSGDLAEEPKKDKKRLSFKTDIKVIEASPEKPKKRKLQDMSNLTFAEDDSIVQNVMRKKKRARIEESVIEDPEVVQNVEIEEQEGKKKKKKKNKQAEAQESFENVEVEDAELVTEEKKKKKNKVKKEIPDTPQSPDEVPIQSKKKKNKEFKIEEAIPDTPQSPDEKLNKKKNKVSKAKEATIGTITNEKPKKKKNKEFLETEVPDGLESIEAMVEKPKKKKKYLEAENNVPDEQENIGATIEKPKKKKKSLDVVNSVPDEQENIEAAVEKPKKKKSRLSDEIVNQENENVEKPKKKSKSLDSESTQLNKKSKKRPRKSADDVEENDDAPESVSFEETRRTALVAMQLAAQNAKAQKQARIKNQQDHTEVVLKKKEVKEKKSLKRLSDEVLDNLIDEPIARAHKRQKLSRNTERNIIMPSTSMFSPGKVAPVNLKVDDGYIPLSVAGGTTEFSVVNLQKAKKVMKKSNAALSFRDKMLNRNARQPVGAYLMYMKKQKAKAGIRLPNE